MVQLAAAASYLCATVLSRHASNLASSGSADPSVTRDGGCTDHARGEATGDGPGTTSIGVEAADVTRECGVPIFLLRDLLRGVMPTTAVRLRRSGDVAYRALCLLQGAMSHVTHRSVLVA